MDFTVREKLWRSSFVLSGTNIGSFAAVPAYITQHLDDHLLSFLRVSDLLSPTYCRYFLSYISAGTSTYLKLEEVTEWHKLRNTPPLEIQDSSINSSKGGHLYVRGGWVLYFHNFVSTKNKLFSEAKNMMKHGTYNLLLKQNTFDHKNCTYNVKKILKARFSHDNIRSLF